MKSPTKEITVPSGADEANQVLTKSILLIYA